MVSARAIAAGSAALRVGFLGVLAAILVTAGNAGGVGSTVAGVARVPFQVGIDRYLPAGTAISMLIGLMLYWRGARTKQEEG